ncbi:MAG: hypothetical protein ISS23_01490 [Nanoarchaeota archaeon]|nr:hypothetical protein [Nanoarchaeota archaeon]
MTVEGMYLSEAIYPIKVELILDLEGKVLEKKVAKEIREEDIDLFTQGAYLVVIDGEKYFKSDDFLDQIIVKEGSSIKTINKENSNIIKRNIIYKGQASISFLDSDIPTLCSKPIYSKSD